MKTELSEGMRVVLDDRDEFVVEGTVRWDAEEGWVAEFDWKKLKPQEEGLENKLDDTREP